MTRIDHRGSADSDPGVDVATEAPVLAGELFGAQLLVAQRYARLLATDGITQGLLGPREVQRIWDRHLINSALLTELIPMDARVVDVGSGAGLPGLAMAIRRPDLQVDTVEPMQRRVRFLTEAVATLGLAERVRVVHGRAEADSTREVVGGALWVVARAVAPLPRLVEWCLPLLAPGGTLLALKGETAARELADSRGTLARLDIGATSVREVGGVDASIRVVMVERAAAAQTQARRRRR